MRETAVAIIFIATILGLYWRPFGARDWQIALVGALLSWLAAPLSWTGGLHVLRDSWSIEAFFLGLMLLAAGAEVSGLYASIAQLLGRIPSQRLQLTAVLLLGSAITAILSNDATPLLLTPAVFAVTSFNPTAAAFATTFTADGASLLLPISNPVGLLFYDHLSIGFGTWVEQILPAAVAGVVVLAVLVWARPGAPVLTLTPRPTEQSSHLPGLQRAASVLFVVLGVAYVAAAVAGFKLGLVTLAGGLGLMTVVWLARPADTSPYRRSVAPGLLIFVAALLLLVAGVSSAGLLDGIRNLFDRLAGQPALVTVAGAALAGMLLSNLVNNWPAAVLLAAVISTADGPHGALLAGALIGCTIGANLTVVGSLSTVFWLSLVHRAGGRVTALEYARRALLPTLAALGAACIVAAATTR